MPVLNLFLLGVGTLLLSACGGSASIIPSPEPGEAHTSIHAIQGNTASSPLEGMNVTVVGIVSGDFQSSDSDLQNDLGGFFIQQENADGDRRTSGGIFIFDGATPVVDVNVGDKVSVDGEVLEHFGETQINAMSVSILGSGAVQAVDLALPLPVTHNSDGEMIADFEPYEGMLVRFPQLLTVVDLFALERFGEVQLAANGRPFKFTNQAPPDVAAYSGHRQLLASMTLVLDDGLSRQNVTPIRFLRPYPESSQNPSIRIGDTVRGLIGHIRYSRGSGSSGNEVFRLLPATPPPFSVSNPREPVPPAVGGNLKIASFNVLNYFSTIDTGQDICGPSGNNGCRGADSIQEFDRQRQKTLAALRVMDADIVGLVELENNEREAIQSIVDGLNGIEESPLWSFVDSGAIGTDVIRVGFIYKTTTVSVVGKPTILDGTVDPRFRDSKNRPVLLQTFATNSNNALINVAVSHLKSKGSSCAAIGDPDLGDGQGNCNITRTSATEALADWLATDPTGSGDTDFLIIGDLNAHLAEDPLRKLETAGFVNLLGSLQGLDAYSFQFRGESGALDHALASPSLMDQVNGVSEWHINADEPPVLDYNLEFGRNAALFDPASPYRASDHDPLIVGLTLNAN